MQKSHTLFNVSREKQYVNREQEESLYRAGW